MSRSISRRAFASCVAGVGAAGLGDRAFAQTPDASPAVDTDGTRVVSAINGEIELTGTPERIVAMEYELVEHLQTVGETPIGACEPESINVWVPLREPLGDDVVDVGTRDEPDLEAIITLEPDLILAASPRQDAVITQLEEIGTTVQLETYSPRSTPSGSETALDHAKGVLRNVALAVNHVEEAEKEIAAFDEYLAQAAERVEELGFKGQPFVYGSIIASDENTINVFTNLSRISATITALGLENAITEDENPGSHFAALSIEQVGTLPDDILFFYSESEPTMDRIEVTLESPVWQTAGFVQNGGVVNLGLPNIWTAGGVITLTDVITRVVGALETR